jgi:hypothetical protein
MLFEILLGLIEIQRKATLFRAEIENHDLRHFGICSNLDVVLGNSDAHSYYLRNLFFNGYNYPIRPYNLGFTNESADHKWGKGEIGEQRVQMLALMIQDLTEFLTKDAK